MPSVPVCESNYRFAVPAQYISGMSTPRMSCGPGRRQRAADAPYSAGLPESSSGPVELWTLVNPPLRCERRWRQRVQRSRQSHDHRRHGECRNAARERSCGSGLRLTASRALSAPAGPSARSARHGVVVIGYEDGQGTMVALDTDPEGSSSSFITDHPRHDSVMRSGADRKLTQIVDNMIYGGVGAESGGLSTNRNGVNINAGSHVFGFELKHGHD